MNNNENLPVTVVTNMTRVYLEEMKSRFSDYQISNEDEFCEALLDIVNLYAETTFANQTEKMQAFLYFHDIEMLINTIYNRIGFQQRFSLFTLVYENLTTLFQAYYTYENYLSN